VVGKGYWLLRGKKIFKKETFLAIAEIGVTIPTMLTIIT